MLPLQEVSHSR